MRCLYASISGSGARETASIVTCAAVEMIRKQRATRATLFPLRTEHEVIDDQLAEPLEEVAERPFAPRKTYGFSTLTQGSSRRSALS
jgi:hypothetical protein